MKTKKGAKKRFKITASGKVLRKKGYSSHLKKKKNSARQRRQQEPTEVSKAESSRLKKLLGV